MCVSKVKINRYILTFRFLLGGKYGRKREFFEFVDNLKEGTDIQKRRFFMFFDVKENQKLETYTSISKKENCTCSAIRNSVNRIRSLLVWVKDEERNNLIKIIKSNDM